MNEPSRDKASASITATFEFSKTGYLKTIFLNAQSSGDEAVLEMALDRLLKPGYIVWIMRLLRWK